MPDAAATYVLHTVLAQPREWRAIGDAAAQIDAALKGIGGELYGAWRSQIGRPRDEVTLVSRFEGAAEASDAAAAVLNVLPPARASSARPMRATLRPLDGAPPTRQGNYAFRTFDLDAGNWDEFEALCAGAWPGFESAYDSQVIGLWRFTDAAIGRAEALLLTRRPDLAMWERSKLPASPAEAEVRAKLSRRYDLCDDTAVATTTLLTAADRQDEARWT